MTDILKNVVLDEELRLADWSAHVWNIQALRFNEPMIDCNPIGQRPAVEESYEGTKKKPSKAQSIIDTIFRNIDIGEITLAEYDDESADFQWESIDGGHRKRSILAYIDGDFATHPTSIVGAKKYRQLTEREKSVFDSYRLRVVSFKNPSNALKGRIFRTRNNVTEVNEQQMLNSFGDIPIANVIRNTVRCVAGLSNTVHKLFEESILNGKKSYPYISFNNAGLRAEEFVARLYYMVYADRLGSSPREGLIAMYSDPDLDDKEVKRLSKKVDDILNFILKVSVARRFKMNNRGVTYREAVLLSRLYLHFGVFTVDDYDIFFDKFKAAFDVLTDANPDGIAAKLYDEPGGASRPLYQVFKGYLNFFEDSRKVTESVEIFLTQFDYTDCVILKDKRRTFKREDIERKLGEQNFTCWVDGLPLTMKDAQGGHIVASSRGGPTEYDNLVVIRAVHNRRMQDTNAHDYKKMWLENQSNVVELV